MKEYLQVANEKTNMNNPSNSPAHGDLGDPCKRTLSQSVAQESHLRAIVAFNTCHADHPDVL